MLSTDRCVSKIEAPSVQDRVDRADMVTRILYSKAVGTTASVPSLTDITLAGAKTGSPLQPETYPPNIEHSSLQVRKRARQAVGRLPERLVIVSERFT